MGDEGNFVNDLSSFFSNDYPSLVDHDDVRQFISDDKRKLRVILQLIDDNFNLDEWTFYQRKFFSITLSEIIKTLGDDKIYYVNSQGNICNILEAAYHYDQFASRKDFKNTRGNIHFIQHSVTYAQRLHNVYNNLEQLGLANLWKDCVIHNLDTIRNYAISRGDTLDEYNILVSTAKFHYQLSMEYLEKEELNTAIYHLQNFSIYVLQAFVIWVRSSDTITAYLEGKNVFSDGTDVYERSRAFLIDKLILDEEDLNIKLLNQILHYIIMYLNKFDGEFKPHLCDYVVRALVSCGRVVGIQESIFIANKFAEESKGSVNQDRISFIDQELERINQNSKNIYEGIYYALGYNGSKIQQNETSWEWAVLRNRESIDRLQQDISVVVDEIMNKFGISKIELVRTTKLLELVLNPPHRRNNNSKTNKKNKKKKK